MYTMGIVKVWNKIVEKENAEVILDHYQKKLYTLKQSYIHLIMKGQGCGPRIPI